MSHPRKKLVHLRRTSPGSTTPRVERPGVRQQTEFASFVHSRTPPSAACSTSCSWPRGCGCASTGARSTTFDVVGRPDTFTVLNALAAVTRTSASAARSTPRSTSRWRSPAVRLAGPPVRRPVCLEPGDQLGRVHRGELPARRLPAPEQRYDRGGGDPRGCQAVVDSWAGDAVRADRAGGVYVPDGAITPVRHRGEQFDVHGRFGTPRSRRANPVLLQSGTPTPRSSARRRRTRSSPARHAGPQAFFADVKGRMPPPRPPPGRPEDLPAATFVLGDSAADARSAPTTCAASRSAGRPRSRSWNRSGAGPIRLRPDGPLPESTRTRRTSRSPGGGCGTSGTRWRWPEVARAGRVEAAEHPQLIIETTPGSRSSHPRPGRRADRQLRTRPTQRRLHPGPAPHPGRPRRLPSPRHPGAAGPGQLPHRVRRPDPARPTSPDTPTGPRALTRTARPDAPEQALNRRVATTPEAWADSRGCQWAVSSRRP